MTNTKNLALVVAAILLSACGAKQPVGSVSAKADIILSGKVRLNISEHLRRHGINETAKYLLTFSHAFSRQALGETVVAAATTGDITLMQSLILANAHTISRGADYNYGGIALIAAIDKEDAEMVKDLATAGVPPHKSVVAHGYGIGGYPDAFPMAFAAQKGLRKMTQVLLEVKIDNTSDAAFYKKWAMESAIKAALKEGHQEIAKDIHEYARKNNIHIPEQTLETQK